MTLPIKISCPENHLFWEIEVLYEDEHLLAINKPPGLQVSRGRSKSDTPSLMNLLHAGIASGKAWASHRGITYLANAHRLDAETSGILLLARTKKVLVSLANLFGSEKPVAQYVALVAGVPAEPSFSVDAPLADNPVNPGVVKVDRKHGKRSRTLFSVVEQFKRHALVSCQPLTFRRHQVRVHLKYAGLPVVGDRAYGGRLLMLSSLKSGYRLKPNRKERPLISDAAVHAQALQLAHPVSQNEIKIEAPLPRDMEVALKYLRRYALNSADQIPSTFESQDPSRDEPLEN